MTIVKSLQVAKENIRKDISRAKAKEREKGHVPNNSKTRVGSMYIVKGKFVIHFI